MAEDQVLRQEFEVVAELPQRCGECGITFTIPAHSTVLAERRAVPVGPASCTVTAGDTELHRCEGGVLVVDEQLEGGS